MISNKRCKCGNQYEIVMNFMYCHKCEIDDETLKTNFEGQGIKCYCDYCIKRVAIVKENEDG